MENKISKGVVPVVFAANDSFAKYMSVAILSLIQNASKNYSYEIYILYDDLSEDTISKLFELNNEYLDIKFINVSAYIENMDLYIRAHYSKEMYYRFLIPEILNEFDKVIYLDGDIIVKGDISELYKEDVSGFYLGAVRNYLNKKMYPYVKDLGISPEKYFNSGVLIINNRLFKNIDVFKFINKYPDLQCPDQDILNIVCQNHVKYLNPKWNFMWQHIFGHENNRSPLLECYREAYEKQKDSPYIIHYTSDKKPWNTKKAEFADIWWNYAKVSPFYKDILKDNNLYLSFWQKIFSVKNIGVHKAVTILGLKMKFKSKKLLKRQEEKSKMEKLNRIIEQNSQIITYLKNLSENLLTEQET